MCIGICVHMIKCNCLICTITKCTWLVDRNRFSELILNLFTTSKHCVSDHIQNDPFNDHNPSNMRVYSRHI